MHKVSIVNYKLCIYIVVGELGVHVDHCKKRTIRTYIRRIWYTTISAKPLVLFGMFNLWLPFVFRTPHTYEYILK